MLLLQSLNQSSHGFGRVRTQESVTLLFSVSSLFYWSERKCAFLLTSFLKSYSQHVADLQPGFTQMVWIPILLAGIFHSHPLGICGDQQLAFPIIWLFLQLLTDKNFCKVLSLQLNCNINETMNSKKVIKFPSFTGNHEGTTKYSNTPGRGHL